MLTALDDSESRIKGIEAGADDFITKPPNKIELMARINALLKMNELNKKLASIESVMVSLANAVEAKDEYTQGHTERVSEFCVKLGKKMELSAIEIDALWIGGILHDIGKIGVSRKILNKPGSLDSEEFEIMKTHSVMGYKICLPLEKNLGPALEAILHHHEKLDGSGYPDGINGDEISVLARIMAIADIFDALDTDRPYRKAFPRAKTFEIMLSEANAGKLDKNILEHLINIIENIS
jgi:putative two-component system response regulator